MTNQPKHGNVIPKPKPAEPAPALPHTPLAGKVFDEHKPLAPKKIIECLKCFWGQDTSRGYRICRGATPGTVYRNMDSSGITQADALWPKVLDSDWCGQGVLP